MLASAGFSVLIINYRGSSGYGTDFASAILRNVGAVELSDLQDGIDHAIGLGLVPEDRVGCMGLSWGGFLTCWAVSHSKRFRAAVSENPITDWVSFAGTSDIGPRFVRHFFGGLPHEDPEIFRRCSPLTLAHTATTPTLLIQGEAD